MFAQEKKRPIEFISFDNHGTGTVWLLMNTVHLSSMYLFSYVGNYKS